MRPITLLLISFLAGCSGEAGHGPITQYDTLASGAVIATSGTVGAWASGLEDEWIPELVTRIGGSASQEDPYLFSSVRGVVVGSGNQIYVLEAQSCEVRVFDLQGRHIRSMGGCGQGPGELLRPMGMVISPRGELWIADPGNGRFQLFDTTGVAGSTYPMAGGVSAAAVVGGFDSDGFFRRPMRTPEGFHLHRIDPTTGTSLDSLPLPPDETDRFILRRMEGGQITGIGIYSIPFALDRQWGFWNNILWTADGDSFEMVGLSMSQGMDTTLVVRRDLPREPIEEAELEGYWETMNLLPSEVRQLDLSKIPETKRSFERFFVDREGYLWVSRWVPGVFGSRQSAMRSYDVFSRDGRFLGTLPLEMKPSPTPWVEGDLLVGVHADELDVPVVVVYRLTGRPSGD
jgi:hypothetical protein